MGKCIGHTSKCARAVFPSGCGHKALEDGIHATCHDGRQVSEPIECLFAVLFTVPIGLDVAISLGQLCTCHRLGVLNGHIAGLSIQALEKERSGLHHLGISFLINYAIVHHPDGATFAEICTGGMRQDKVPFFDLMCSTIHSGEDGGSMQIRGNIPLDVPLWMAFRPAWLNVA